MILETIRTKIRALVEDISTCQTEVFKYEGSNIFPLCGENISSVTSVLKNGVELASGETYDLDSTNKTVTITATFADGDQVEIKYCSQKYSDSELDEFIRASLVWLSIYSYCSDEDFELEEDDIYPTPSNKEQDLIAFISSILIKPDYSRYSLPNLTVVYPRTMEKYIKIREIINRFRRGLGVNDVIEFEEYV